MKVSLAHPELAPLALAALLLVGLCALALARRQRALAAFGGQGARLASASPTRQLVKLALVAVACLGVVAALIGPQIGEEPRQRASAIVDTVIALDVSQSMAVRDVAPDRLHVAQQAIEALGNQLGGGRVGLTLFAGNSVIRYPLTAYTKIVGPALETSGRGFKITPGSSLRAALQGAAGLFPTGPEADKRPKAIIVVSDGEDLSPDLPLVEPLLQRNIRIFTLGVGTPEGGSIPVYDATGRLLQMLVDANGTQVTSRLDESRLRSLAEQGRGEYRRYDDEAAARSLAEALRAIDTGVIVAEGGVTPEDRYQIFLGIAVLALIAEWVVDERRQMPRPRVPRARPSARRRLLGLVGAALLGVTACGSADPLADEVDAANGLYLHDPAAALTRYRDILARRPSSPEVAIDLANTLAKLGDHERALVEYRRALETAKGTTRAIAFYDRGNALFRLGRIVEARASYVEGLRLDPNDRDAKFNIEIIDRLLDTAGQPPQSGPPGQGTGPPGPSQPPGGGATGATGPTSTARPGGTAPPGSTGATGASGPPSVQTALTDFRRDLSVEEALRLLDALRGEQRGLPALLEGTGIRRGANIDVPR